MNNQEFISLLTCDALFNPAECDAIIANARAWETGTTGGTEGEVKSTEHRKCDFAPITPERFEWVYQRIMGAAHQANQRFQVQITGLQPIQLCRYGEGGYYRNHIDLGSSHALLRKLSVVVFLDRPDDYGGGELVFPSGDAGQALKLNKGDAVVFPSFLLHRVDEVTRGTRHTLVTWVQGNRWQ